MIPKYNELLDRGWRVWIKIDINPLLLCPIKDFDNIPDGEVMEL